MNCPIKLGLLYCPFDNLSSPTLRICPFLVSARKGRKETDLRGGFLQRRPLLKISPPKPQEFLRKQFDAKVCRPSLFRPLRFGMHFRRCGGGFLRGRDLLVAPLKSASFRPFLAETRKGHTLRNDRHWKLTV